jgi:hypothetical protein
VSDVEDDLRTLLREKAEEVRIGPAIPREILRRARRRRVAYGTLAMVVVAGLVAGGVGISRLVLAERTTPRLGPGGPDGPVAESYPFIYPPNRQQLDTTRAEVADGSMPMWTDPLGTAILFAVNVMGWDMEDVEVSVRGDDPITAVIANPAVSEAAGSGADIRTTLELVRLTDPTMYAVLAAEAEGVTLEPVGPDDQVGAGGRIAIRGSLGFIPEGATVELRVGEGPPASDQAPRGQFFVIAELADPPGPSTLVSVAVKDGAGNIVQLTSSRLATPLAGTSDGKSSEVGPSVPGPVGRTRDAILDAAQAFDWEALRALIPEEGFTFSFGDDTDPIAYWQRLEDRAHVPVIGDILPMVLGTIPARQQGIYIWPAPAAEDPADWDEHDLEVLRQIHVEEDIRAFQEMGLYTGWRAGIEADGTWVFFVSGD